MTESEMRQKLGLLSYREAKVLGRLKWADWVKAFSVGVDEAYRNMDRSTGRTTNTLLEALSYMDALDSPDDADFRLFVIFPTESIARQSWSRIQEYGQKLNIDVSRCRFISSQTADDQGIRDYCGYDGSKIDYIEDHPI